MRMHERSLASAPIIDMMIPQVEKGKGKVCDLQNITASITQGPPGIAVFDLSTVHSIYFQGTKIREYKEMHRFCGLCWDREQMPILIEVLRGIIGGHSIFPHNGVILPSFVKLSTPLLAVVGMPWKVDGIEEYGQGVDCHLSWAILDHHGVDKIVNY